MCQGDPIGAGIFVAIMDLIFKKYDILNEPTNMIYNYAITHTNTAYSTLYKHSLLYTLQTQPTLYILGNMFSIILCTMSNKILPYHTIHSTNTAYSTLYKHSLLYTLQAPPTLHSTNTAYSTLYKHSLLYTLTFQF